MPHKVFQTEAGVQTTLWCYLLLLREPASVSPAQVAALQTFWDLQQQIPMYQLSLPETAATSHLLCFNSNHFIQLLEN